MMAELHCDEYSLIMPFPNSSSSYSKQMLLLVHKDQTGHHYLPLSAHLLHVCRVHGLSLPSTIPWFFRWSIGSDG